ncbi:unnamed protein product [Spodoptera littoralis]|uniref:Uncharacterized protein n=1 Tax=Spodoptera littoralis TaxID=7109 RepID=A0A9P0N1R4_SPOLI|nr:unnamed protein product [Spodoptera littoralis]
MQNNDHDPELENKLLYNSLLFASILKKKAQDEKIKKIEKYLERGADINAIEANYKNNTPLHLAVIKEEPELVEFLLQKGAQYKKKNYDGKSALDLAHSRSGNPIKRKEIITLLETFANNNLKPVNLNNLKPPKRPGCPFIIKIKDEDSEVTSITPDSKDFREYISQPSTSIGEDNTNTIVTKSLIRKEDEYAIENSFNQPHSSEDLFFSSPHGTNVTSTESVKANIDEVTKMLENLIIRDVNKPKLNQTEEYEKTVHWKEDFKIPSSVQSPDTVSSQGSKSKTSDNKYALAEDKKAIGNNLKQPERKISYIQKNIQAISKKSNKYKTPEGKDKFNVTSIKYEKPTEKVRKLQNSKDLGITSSSPESNIDADLKKPKEKAFSSAKDKNDGKDLKMRFQHTDLTSLNKCKSQTLKSKERTVPNTKNCEIKASSAIISTKTKINTEKKVQSSVIYNKPVEINVKQPRLSKHLKISSSLQNVENVSLQNHNIKMTKYDEVNKIVEIASDEERRKEGTDSLREMKELVKSNFKLSNNSKTFKISSSQQHIKYSNSPSLAKNKNEDNKTKSNVIQSQDCIEEDTASIQQVAAALATAKSNSSIVINEETQKSNINPKICDIGEDKNATGNGREKHKEFLISPNERQIVGCLSHSDSNKLANNKDLADGSVISDISQISIVLDSTNNKCSVQSNGLNPLQIDPQEVKLNSIQGRHQKSFQNNDNNVIVKNQKLCDLDSEIILSTKANERKTDKSIDIIQNVSGETVLFKKNTGDLTKDQIFVESDVRQQLDKKGFKKSFNQQCIDSISMHESVCNSSQSKNQLNIVERTAIGNISEIPEDLVSVYDGNQVQNDVQQLQHNEDTHSSQQQTNKSNFQSLDDKGNINDSTVISDIKAVTKSFEEHKPDLNNDRQYLRDNTDLNLNISSNQQNPKGTKSSKKSSKNSKNKETNKVTESSKISDIGGETNKNDLLKYKETIDSELNQPQNSKHLERPSNKQEIEGSSIPSKNKKNFKNQLKNSNRTDLIDRKQILDAIDLNISPGQQSVENDTVKSNKQLKESKDSETCSSQQSNEAAPKTKANSKTSKIKGETKMQKNSGDNKVKKEGSLKDKNDVKPESNSKKSNKKKVFLYPKRTGTSGLSGQLYETKLLSLILLRSLYIQEVPKFFIGTNAENMGAFDDVVFRYYSGNDQKPSMMFLQAKHRDNPAKEKFTVDELKKLNGDFSLHKYLESYIKISQMFMPDTKDDMFIGEFKNIDCEFIIYTSAFENFSKLKVIEQSKVKSFINTTNGKVFQFNYDEEDVEDLIVTVVKARAVLLAKRLSRFIFKDNNNYNNMMMDELIKTYHVFLARHIIDIKLTGEEAPNFYNATFRESFLTSNTALLIAFKTTLCKEAIQLKKGTDNVEEVENMFKTYTFKVPITFGNLNFCFTGNEQKKEKKLEYLCSLFKKLLEIADVSINNILIKIDDDKVGPNEILQSTDLETYRIGGLVGNLLILDEKTMTMKFNLDFTTLSPDNIKLLERLRNEVFVETDLSKYRFDINVHRFARLSLVHEKYDKGLIKDFLNKLIFYTNQATEDKVEDIVKKEIDEFFVGNIPRQRDQLFKVKSHAIFLKAHDLVQKWWKISGEAPYLTESCQYFLDAEKDVLNSPLLNVLNFTYIKTVKITMCEIKFKDVITGFFHLNSFLEGTIQIMTIITEEIALTSMKLLQNFKENHYSDYTFIDLDYIANSNYFANVKVEIKESKIQTLIIVCKSEHIFAELNLLIKHFKGKVILICIKDLIPQIDGIPTENIVSKVDLQIGFDDLDDTMCEMLRNERYIIFQGKEVKLGVLFEDQSYQLLNSNVLYKIINNEHTLIGRHFNNPSYDEILDYYIKEQVCRYVTLEKDIEANDDFDIMEYNKLGNNFEPRATDIVLITDNEAEYVNFKEKYENCNVHWFRNDENCLVWQQSQGNLSNILKHVKKNSHDAYKLQPETLKDIKEKVVIISAEPGMGKSSLLTHLAINTKEKYPSLWISKINLLDFINEFKNLEQHKVTIDFKEVVKFLFRAIGFEASKDKTCNFELVIDHVSVKDQDICLNVDKEGSNITGLNLFEIQLFVHCFNNNRVALLFDGFDEICPDYANEFMQIANILKNSKLAHLWITSRLYNVLHQLESVMQTFSFTIEPLSEDDQRQFLKKIWSTRNVGKSMLSFPLDEPWFLPHSIKGFLAVLSAVFTDTNSKFISIPLHLYMIAEIFQDSYHTFPLNAESYESFISEQNTMNKINLNQIYQRFIDIKFFKIRFGEKKPLLCINDPDMRKLIENERDTFFYNHKIIAAYIVFGKMNEMNFLDENDTKQIRNFIERIKLGEEKTGIIEQIVLGEPKFVHYTFAEYFGTEFLCDRLKTFQSRSYMWTYLINTFLESEVGGPQRFFNAKLGNHPNFYNIIHNIELKPMFENWLQQHEKMAKLIYTAVDQYLENTALFLLKCIEHVLTNTNLKDFIKIVSKSLNSCILCIATKRNAERVVKFILDSVKNVNASQIIDLFNCCDLPYSNPLLIAYGQEKWQQSKLVLLHLFLSDLPPQMVVEVFSMNFDKKWFNRIKSKKYIHIVSESIGVEDLNFNRPLSKLSEEQLVHIFTLKDSENKLAAHRAASSQSYNFFDKLESLVNKNEFKKICMSLDKSGLTPLHYFVYNSMHSDKLERLLDVVYGDQKTGKLTLQYFIDKRNKSK